MGPETKVENKLVPFLVILSRNNKMRKKVFSDYTTYPVLSMIRL